MKVLDLFSGIGGFSLGLERAGMETVAFCEIDPFCQKVLKKHWPETPIYEDIKELDGTQFYGTVGLVCGGFPCQPYSSAGNRRGEEDDRALWPEMFRVIRECKPAFVIGENVSGFIDVGLDTVLSNLGSEGYTARGIIIPACAVGHPHRRDRVWILAHTKGINDGDGIKNKATGQTTEFREGSFGGRGYRANKPRVDRVTNGVSLGMDRNRRLGNAVVPQIPEIIGRAIMEIENG